MKAILDHTEIEAPYISTFYFQPEYPLQYQPGQYIELTLPHIGMDNRGDSRPFALSSSPTEELISITNKFAPKDGSSFKRALRQLKPGDALEMSEAKGVFVLPEDPTVPLVFVAGGIGVTPFRSMALWLAAKHESRNVQLFYAVNHEKEVMFQPVLEQAIPNITTIASDASTKWQGERGYINADYIIEHAKPTTSSLLYISGPEGLVQMLHTDLRRRGIKKDQLIVDLFTGYVVNSA